MIPLPADPALPGLALLADRPAYAAALRQALAAAAPGLGKLQDIGYRRIRHRLGERAIIQCELRFDGPAGPLRKMASVWLFPREKARKRAGKGAPGLVFEPQSGSLLYLFPHDPHVPGVALFHADPAAHAAALFAQAGPAANLNAPEPVRYRPGLGATWRWSAGRVAPVYVKIYGDGDAARDARDLARMHDASAGKTWTVPAVSGFDAALPAIALSEVRGVTLATMLERLPAFFARSSIDRVVEALGDFHREVPLPDRVKGRDHFAGRAATAAGLISVLMPELTAPAFELADWIASTPVSLHIAPAHCDIKLEHVVFSNGRVTLLDLDSFALADPLFDFAMLEMRIAASRLQGRCPAEAAHEAERAVRITVARTGQARTLERYGWLKACAALQVAKFFCQNAGENHSALASDCLRIGKSGRELAVKRNSAGAARPAAAQTQPLPYRENGPCVSS